MKQKSLISIVLGLFILSFLLTACGPAATSAPAEEAPAAEEATAVPAVEATAAPAVEATAAPVAEEKSDKYGGVLRVARVADVYKWDPQYIDENDSLWASTQIYSALLKVSQDGTQLEPFLADSFEMNPEATEFVFNLNKDAKFCDGTPITSEDVKFSFERATESPAVQWMVPAGMSYDVSDPNVFKITLEEPNVALPWWVTLWGMQVVSKAYAESHTAEQMLNEPLGSGVFCLKEWKKGEAIVLEPNPYSWLKDAEGNQLPYVDEVQWLVVPDANSRTLMLEAGEVDVAIDPPYNQVEALDAKDGISATTADLMGEATIWLNMNKFSDPKVRQAVNYAVDKESLIDFVLEGFGKQALSFLYLGKYTNEDYGFPFDLEKAKQLMAESSSPDGFDAELLIVAGDKVMEDTAVVLKDQLANIGINVTITPLESGSFFDRWFAGDFDMLYKLSTLDIYDSSENLNIDINDAGFTGWKDEELWAFAQKASANPNETERAQQFDELQKRYMEAPPQLPLFHPLARWGQSDKVNGFSIMNTNLHPFYYTYLTKE